LSKKKLCKFHERKRVEETERKQMESWLCVFYDDVFCQYSEIGPNDRLCSVCQNCKYYERWEGQMEDEDERIMAEIDEILKTGEWK
jgi:hypothetical protein